MLKALGNKYSSTVDHKDVPYDIIKYKIVYQYLLFLRLFARADPSLTD